MALPKLRMQSANHRKQLTLFIGIIASVLICSFLTIYLFDNRPKNTPEIRKAAQVRLSPREEEEEHFKAVFETRVRQLEEDARVRSLREKELNEQLVALRGDRDALRKELSLIKTAAKAQGEDGWPPPAQLTQKQFGKLPPAPEPASPGFTTGKYGLKKIEGEEPEVRRPRLVITDVSAPGTQAKQPIPSQALTYLPSGTFAKARLLNGAVAPTRGQGSGNPVPLLMELTDNAVMPNLYKSGIKRCFITANATGELASERVLVRLDRLSCIDDKGGAVDTKLQGYVSGEDGKTGLRARLVTKSGQAIANALFTGTLSGLGKAVSIAAEETNTSIAGSVTTSVRNPWRAGIGEGSSYAMDRITDYYLKLASDMFPVLEVDSGREIEVVISQGISIERLNKNK